MFLLTRCGRLSTPCLIPARQRLAVMSSATSYRRPSLLPVDRIHEQSYLSHMRGSAGEGKLRADDGGPSTTWPHERQGGAGTPADPVHVVDHVPDSGESTPSSEHEQAAPSKAPSRSRSGQQLALEPAWPHRRSDGSCCMRGHASAPNALELEDRSWTAALAAAARVPRVNRWTCAAVG